MSVLEIRVPDIGDFKSVPVIELMAAVGDVVALDDSLLMLESDKATMEIPAPASGTLLEWCVAVGDTVSEGTLIAKLTVTAASTVASAPVTTVTVPSVAVGEITCDVLVLGAGPGGYTAAFRAADLGKKVVLVERWPTLGGVCLNVGCIPSKALLHTAKIITEAAEAHAHGVSFAAPTVDLAALREWKAGVVGKLTQGLAGLAKQRKVTVLHGVGEFTSPHTVQVRAETGVAQVVRFSHAIIAAGSEPVRLPHLPQDPRIIDSTGALALEEIPARLLVIGGGIIGMEMATVYDALGSAVTVVELGASLFAGCDPDLVKPLHQRMKQRLAGIWLNTKVSQLAAKTDGLWVTFEGENAPSSPQCFDKVLLAVGRTPNGGRIGAQAAGVAVDARGFIAVDKQQRTNVSHIFAIGDIVGQPMLAHKAVHEGKIAAEVIAGHKVAFEAYTIPSVAYTDPEVAWMGLTETAAKAEGIAYEKATFPWAASGRALSIGRPEGFTKVLLDKETRRILGAGIVGVNAGELLAEAVLALEMGADMHDLGLTIHPHPTLSETLCFAAEMAEGTITDLYAPKRK